jgi:hypothetical protein
MTDDKTRIQPNGRLEQGNSDPVEQQSPQTQTSAKPQSERRTAPGRIPLFRR